jgi:hypothetical protein
MLLISESVSWLRHVSGKVGAVVSVVGLHQYVAYCRVVTEHIQETHIDIY